MKNPSFDRRVRDKKSYRGHYESSEELFKYRYASLLVEEAEGAEGVFYMIPKSSWSTARVDFAPKDKNVIFSIRVYSAEVGIRRYSPIKSIAYAVFRRRKGIYSRRLTKKNEGAVIKELSNDDSLYEVIHALFSGAERKPHSGIDYRVEIERCDDKNVYVVDLSLYVDPEVADKFEHSMLLDSKVPSILENRDYTKLIDIIVDKCAA